MRKFIKFLGSAMAENNTIVKNLGLTDYRETWEKMKDFTQSRDAASADELWIIWTVSERSVWRNGFIAQYFQIIESAANGRFRADLARIAIAEI